MKYTDFLDEKEITELISWFHSVEDLKEPDVLVDAKGQGWNLHFLAIYFG